MFQAKGFRFVAGLLLFSSIASAQLQITTTSVPAVTQYQSYSTTLTATGGTPPYSWSVVSSSGVSLPEGMSLNASTGVVSATQVNGQGGYAVTVQVTDNASPSHHTANATLNFGVYSDSSLAGCQIFPADSIYNQRIDLLPVDTTPAHQIPAAYLNNALHPDFGHGFYPEPGGIPWMRVPANQPTTSVYLEGDGQIQSAGTYSWPYPAWPNALIEGTSYGVDGADHHILILQSSVNNITGPQTGPCKLYETYQSNAVQTMFNAGTNRWDMTAGVLYDLSTDEIAQSDSTLDTGAQDSPGIPMMPLLLRYSEVPLLAHHSLRITFPGPTNGWVWPGTGCCSGSRYPQGLLYRLKGNVNWQLTCPATSYPQAATLLQTLQQYGAYMSDHGSAGYIQGVPDIGWDDDDLGCFKHFKVSDLEVVDNSMLEISDISGQTKPFVVPTAPVSGTVNQSYNWSFTAVGGNPATVNWAVSSGTLPPGLVLNASTGRLSGILTSSAGTPYQFHIVATDTASGYSSAAQTFSIAVKTFVLSTTDNPPVSITIASVPVGLKVSVDGGSYTTPQTFSWAQGSSHLLSAVSSQGVGTRNTFANWSDGGAPSHSILVPAVSATYTANFTSQYLLTTKTSPAHSGTITVSPASADGYYNSSSQVQLTASPAFGQRFSSFSGDMTGPADPQNLVMSAPRSVTANFVPLPRFGVIFTHGSTFTKGQKSARYSLAVSNISATATSGDVTVSDNVPAGMILVSMAGEGWTCPRLGLTCTRSDSLESGASYPPITVTVDIASNASFLLMNAAMVSGGGAPAVTATQTILIQR